MADKDDDLYETVSAMADRLKLKGQERTKYVHDHMTRGGYRAIPQYVPADDGDDDDDDSDDTPFFSRKRRKPRGGATNRTKRDDDDW